MAKAFVGAGFESSPGKGASMKANRLCRACERRNVKIRGVVQGVFFRETVLRIASRHDVAGFVRNVGLDVVEIEAEGEPRVVDAFIGDVLDHPPPSARIKSVQSRSIPPLGEAGFSIVLSAR
jgi:hydrogenase maturation factor HypF (carbamoyltransferase family)